MKIILRTSFKKDFKREKKTDKRVPEALREVMDYLIQEKALPWKFRDHPLSGRWRGYRDCHLKPDLVLIYKVTDDDVTLVRLGSHSELF